MSAAAQKQAGHQSNLCLFMLNPDIDPLCLSDVILVSVTANLMTNGSDVQRCTQHTMHPSKIFNAAYRHAPIGSVSAEYNQE